VTTTAAIFFDVDGVLIDSLRAHLQICRDKNRQFKLGLEIPTADEFRELVRSGIAVSPMKQFFLAVGFPEEFAAKADEDYRRDFAKRYRFGPFPGTKHLLVRLSATGVALGVVTSNTARIVRAVLGQAARVFHKDLFFTVDDPRRLGKSEALLAGARSLDIEPATVLYVGDQPKDFAAAQAAGAQFLGVTFGWGIAKTATRFPTVDSMAQLERELLRRATARVAIPRGRGVERRARRTRR
jgi:N-acetyl-D-muramate 6-phosphate phosphatase